MFNPNLKPEPSYNTGLNCVISDVRFNNYFLNCTSFTLILKCLIIFKIYSQGFRSTSKNTIWNYFFYRNIESRAYLIIFISKMKIKKVLKLLSASLRFLVETLISIIYNY